MPAASPRPVASPEHTAGAVLADRLGIRVDRADPSLGGCGAVATFPAPPDAVLPTGAVLALVDATARAAAEVAVTVPGRRRRPVPLLRGGRRRRPVRRPGGGGHGPVDRPDGRRLRRPSRAHPNLTDAGSRPRPGQDDLASLPGATTHE